MKHTLALAWLDLRNIYRESMLLVIALVPLFVTLLVRFGLPPLTAWSAGQGFDLAPHTGFIQAYLLLFPAMMLGMAMGYVLLDERDEQVLSYVSVTPLGKSGYLRYRLLSPVAGGVVYALVLPLLLGMGWKTTLVLSPAALLAGMQAPLFVLAMGAFAGDKVEGLALAKVLSVVFLAPIVAYVPGAPWKWLCLVIAPAWVTECALAGLRGAWGATAFYFVGGVLVLGGWLLVLARRFIRRMG